MVPKPKSKVHTGHMVSLLLDICNQEIISRNPKFFKETTIFPSRVVKVSDCCRPQDATAAVETWAQTANFLIQLN